MSITVPERGVSNVPRDEWKSLSNDPQFWRLVENNILHVEAGRSGGVKLRGTCYVGRALIGSQIVQVVEKFSGAFASLVSLGLLKPPKITSTPSALAESSNSLAVLVSLFLQAVRKYLAGHRKVSYVQIPDSGIFIGGRLNIAGTLRLRARGLNHRAAFTRTSLTGDIPFNRCIYAALRSIERLSRVAALSQSDVTSARALRLAFSECLPAVLRSRQGELAQTAAKEASTKQPRAEVHDAISLAGAVLDVAGFGGDQAWDRSIPRSWFVNLEGLFEEAIRKEMRTYLLPPLITESAWNRPPLFSLEPDRYRANPDIVVLENGRATAIADAKYKEFSGWPEQSDIFELLAHAAAYRATLGLMFYPSDAGFSVRSLGKSETNCSVWAFGITFHDFSDDVRRSLEIAGLLPSAPSKTH